MNIRTDPKDGVTEQLRQIIGRKVPKARETDEAEAGLTTLSFQSDISPERHLWLETYSEGINIDLEDRNIQDEWDNAVARVKVKSPQEAAEVARVWLSGEELNNYYTGLNKEYQAIVKKDWSVEKSP